MYTYTYIHIQVNTIIQPTPSYTCTYLMFCYKHGRSSGESSLHEQIQCSIEITFPFFQLAGLLEGFLLQVLLSFRCCCFKFGVEIQVIISKNNNIISTPKK